QSGDGDGRRRGPTCTPQGGVPRWPPIGQHETRGGMPMNVWKRLAGASAAAALTVVGVGAAPTEAGRARPDVVVVRGDVHHRLKLTAADIEALPQQTVKVTFQSGTTSQTHTYTGALLLDVLVRADPNFDPNIKNDSLAHVVTATGSDGYRAT